MGAQKVSSFPIDDCILQDDDDDEDRDALYRQQTSEKCSLPACPQEPALNIDPAKTLDGT